MLKAVAAEHPETPLNPIRGATHHLFQRGDGIVKIARGTYQLARFAEADVSTEDTEARTAAEDVTSEAADAERPSAGMLTEQDFYASFAEWLEENDEVTVASALGGSSLGGKWGTPDVIGVLRPRAQDIFKFEPQIVTAEIKATPAQPVVAFGQAVAYCLFSHKSYIVVPRTTTSGDMNRLTSLCSIHGVGLVVFTLDRELPDYAVVVLPAVANPDMFYVNTMLDRLKASEPRLLNPLF
ncbi:hypothetical protein [Novosphingobium sp. Gsoil 351]|uniref:hypothetical protein n=1 Tax=Novosphingobium sp. Gsoil 351 TaxID=2675225 RepID=UPI0018A857DF|nr:hypothetical protein [Novosphingobium sp. Gsoil 351]